MDSAARVAAGCEGSAGGSVVSILVLMDSAARGAPHLGRVRGCRGVSILVLMDSAARGPGSCWEGFDTSWSQSLF